MKYSQFIKLSFPIIFVAVLSACGGATPATAPTSDAASSVAAVVSASASKSSMAASLASSNAADTQAPTMPTALMSGSVTTTSVTISWNGATDNVAITGYQIYRDNQLLSTVTASTQMMMDSSVTANKAYVYGVKAGDAAGNWSSMKTLNVSTPAPISGTQSSVSSIVQTSSVGLSIASSSKAASVTASIASSTVTSVVSSSRAASSASSADTTAPTAPSNLRKTSLTQTSITLSWAAASDNKAVTGYRVFRNGTLIASLSATTLTYTDTSAQANQTYVYGVSAGDAAGNWSSVATVTVQPASLTLLPATGLSISGTVAHGSVITITDASARFGTRNNVKPLYVSLGNQKAGNSLGRKTGDYYNIGSTASTLKSVGALTQVYRYDFKGTETANAIWGNETFFTEDATRPLLQYVERYYDFDIYQSQYQSGGQFNLKTNRLWGNWNLDPNVCDLYVGYNGSWQAPETGAVAPEHTPDSPTYMNTIVPSFQWLSEEYVFQNSTVANAADGVLEFYRNNTLQNPNKTNWITFTTTMPQPLSMVFFDQVSNGSGSGVANVFEYLGYINLDDEYKRVYLSDSPTRAPGSKLIPMIQTAWSPSSINIQLVNSQLPLSGNYLHIRLDKNTWIDGIRLP